MGLALRWCVCVLQEEAATYRHLGAILRHCIMSTSEGEERTEEMHRYTHSRAEDLDAQRFIKARIPILNNAFNCRTESLFELFETVTHWHRFSPRVLI